MVEIRDVVHAILFGIVGMAVIVCIVFLVAKNEDVSVASRHEHSEVAPPEILSDKWYAIDSLEHKCRANPDSTPGNLIRNSQVAGDAYISRDTTDPASGRIVQTTIDFPLEGRTVTYYRGVERCQMALNQIDSTQKSDVDKYK